MQRNAVAFSKLPKDVQSKLIELQTPSPDRFVFLAKTPILAYLAIAVGIGWTIYMFIATADYLWEPWMFWIFAAITLILVTLAIFSAFRILRSLLQKTRDGYVFTRDECISFAGDRIGFRGLKELESFQFLENIRTIEVWIGEVVEKIKAHDSAEAMRLDESFIDMRAAAGDPFLKPIMDDSNAFNPGPAKAALVAVVLGALLASIGLSYAARVMNRSHDDDQSWKRTENSQTVADFVAYKDRHPTGRNAAAADQKIAEIMNRSKEAYTNGLKSSSNPSAVAALTALFDSVAANGERKVYVRFTEDRQLDETIVKKLKKDTGLPISSYDFTIPTTAFQFRKEKILNDISVAFLPATRNASIEFQLIDEVPAGSPVIEVKSVMKSIEFYYYFNWYSTTGGNTTFYNPGAKFEFDIEFRPGNDAGNYKSQYISNFTQNLKPAAFDMRDAANYSFDKVYFGAVSEDLAKFLQREFGFIE